MADEEQGENGDRAFTEITEESYCEKMKQSCGNSVLGIVLFFLSFVLLVWNEGRTVKRAQDIDEGREVVVTIDNLSDLTNATLRSQYDKALIYVTGDLTTQDPLYDPVFGVGAVPSANDTSDTTSPSTPAPPLKLSRSVEMYQWVETSRTRTEKTSNGGSRTITEYDYDTQWSSYLVDSTAFKERTTSRTNPEEFPFTTDSWVADPILLKDVLVLGDAAVRLVNWYQDVGSVSVDNVPDATLQQRLTPYRSNGFFYSSPYHNKSSSNSNPRVGDTRITFDQVPSSTVSIIAGYDFTSTQVDNYVTTGGRFFLILKQGTFSPEELFTQADNENTTLAWILRFVGFACMVVGILLVLQPLANAVDIIPFVGDCMQGGMEGCLFPLIAVLIALPLSLFTISLAWLAYRPMWSIPILVVSTGIMVTDDHASGSGGDFKPSAPSSAYTSGTNGSGMGGFANALDQPPPSQKPTNGGGDDEVEIPVAAADPYVPYVYKP